MEPREATATAVREPAGLRGRTWKERRLLKVEVEGGEALLA